MCLLVTHTSARQIRYLAVDDADKRGALLGHGLPGWIVDMLEEYAQAYASGWGGQATGSVAALTGRPALDIADFARDHAGHFGLTAGNHSHGTGQD